MKAIFETDFTDKCEIIFEHTVCIGGSRYILMFGHHANGGFICIPNLGVCCEACDHLYSSEYNSDKLILAGLDRTTADALAAYIDNNLLMYK